MASRNRTLIFRKYRDALRSVRVPTGSSPASASPSTSSGTGGPVIELVSSSLLHPNRSYAPLSTEDPGNSRSISVYIHVCDCMLVICGLCGFDPNLFFGLALRIHCWIVENGLSWIFVSRDRLVRSCRN